MNVLVIYAHPSLDSFTHAILEQVTEGLDDGPHSYEVNDLYASGFDPVFTERDSLSFLHEGLPEELLREANPGRWSSSPLAARCVATWRGGG